MQHRRRDVADQDVCTLNIALRKLSAVREHKFRMGRNALKALSDSVLCRDRKYNFHNVLSFSQILLREKGAGFRVITLSA